MFFRHPEINGAAAVEYFEMPSPTKKEKKKKRGFVCGEMLVQAGSGSGADQGKPFAVLAQEQ